VAGWIVDWKLRDLHCRSFALEKQSGFQWDKPNSSEQKLDLDTYSSLSLEIHWFLYYLTALRHEIDELEEILSELVNPIPRWKAILTNNNNIPLKPALESRENTIREGAYILQQRRKEVANILHRLDRRAQNTLQLVSKAFPQDI
jgi:hypothetical protein